MIRKAVIPAAGFGTRFLPASKSQPKEMLPIVDKPAIQYVVEEAVASGITDILMVIGKGKRAIEEHFDRNFELEAELAAKGKTEELEAIREISRLADVHFVWQKELRGLGHAIWCARHHVESEPFAVLLGDTVFESARVVTKRLIDVFEERGASVVALEEVEQSRISRYGVISGQPMTEDTYLLDGLVEKPAAEEAPSNLAIAGRYVFAPGIFECLARIEPAENGEMQLTDAMRLMLRSKEMYGLKLDCRRYDIGNKVDFIRTNVAFALAREELRGEVSACIKDLARDL